MRAGKVSIEPPMQTCLQTGDEMRARPRRSGYAAKCGSAKHCLHAGLSQATALKSRGGVVMVKVNGTELDIAGKTVTEYLATTNYDPKRIAVEQNGDIVFKSRYDVTILNDGDSLEIVSFVGGG